LRKRSDDSVSGSDAAGGRIFGKVCALYEFAQTGLREKIPMVDLITEMVLVNSFCASVADIGDDLKTPVESYIASAIVRKARLDHATIFQGMNE
jgi:hypothetical protein